MRILSSLGGALALLGLALAQPGLAAAGKEKAVDPLAASGHGGFSFAIEPIPKWVTTSPLGASTQLEHAPVHYRILESQILVEASGTSTFTHYVRVVDDSAGLSKAAEVETEFDPNYQTLAFHHIEIVRAGKHINRLERSKVQLLQRETQLERQMYDGSVTASIIIEDVRVGDEIDVAYTVRGSNPVFDGHAVGSEYLNSIRGPAALSQVRILYPVGRTINVKTFDDATQTERKTQGSQQELLIKAGARPQILTEPNETNFSFSRYVVFYDDFGSWNAVARWGTQLFKESGAETPTVDAKASEIMAANTDQRARLLAALQFVQTEVRYFGTELGASSHRPASPEKVINQRFGDCKDKVMLLIALLRRMQIEAKPVLVSTGYRSHIADFAPSPLVFNHVIARVQLEGTIYYLDGTRDRQTGTLTERQATGLGQGLLLSENTTEPLVLPSATDEVHFAVQDIFTLTDLTKDAMLESRQTYFGAAAEGIRMLIAAKQPSEVETILDTWYSRAYPKIHTVAPMEIEDSKEHDKLTVVQHFAVTDAAHLIDKKTLRIPTVNWSLIELLRIPYQQNRVTAYALRPGRATHDVEIHFPEDLYSKTEPKVTDDSDAVAAIHLESSFEPRVVKTHDEVQFLDEELAPSGWAAHSAFVNKNLNMFGANTPIPLFTAAQSKAAADATARYKADALAGKIKVYSARQAQANVDRIYFTCALDSNHMPEHARAEMFAARGVDNDTLGDTEAGGKDFAAALALSPEDATILESAAQNANRSGDYAQAIQFASQVLAQKPGDDAALNTQALAYYLQKNYAQAISNWQTVLKSRAAVERGYPLLWLALAVRQSGGDGKAALQPYADAGLASTWPRPLIDMQLGKMTPEQAMSAAKTVDANKTRDQLSEAFFFLGEAALIDGNRTTASADYQLVLNQNLSELMATNLSKRRLAELR